MVDQGGGEKGRLLVWSGISSMSIETDTYIPSNLYLELVVAKTRG